jgi:hypothetical protein
VGSAAGTNVFEIPDASYFRDTPLVDDNGNGPSIGDSTGIKTAPIPAPNGGNYQIEITGTGAGAYMLEFGASWPTGGQYTNVAGSTDVGITATNLFFVVLPPAITNVNPIGDSLSFSFLSQPGATYFVQRKSTIKETNWITVRSVPGTGATIILSETNCESSGFFRSKAE